MRHRSGKLKIQASTVLIIAILLFGAWYVGIFEAMQPGSIVDVGDVFKQDGTGYANEGVVVTKPLRIAIIDKYVGSAVASASVKIFNGQQLLESLTTDASGIAISTLSYSSDTILDILVVKGNSKAWYSVSVPRMNEFDAQANNYNQITLEFFTLASVSLQVRDSLGNSYTSGGILDKSVLGVDVLTLTISWFVTADNTGYISSYDPINNVNWNVILYIKSSGAFYENVVITGAKKYSIGLSNWFYFKINDDEVTRWRVGNQYRLQGSGSRSLSIDLAGYNGNVTAGQYTTLEITIVAYSDPNYHNVYGTFGPDAVVLSTFTLRLDG